MTTPNTRIAAPQRTCIGCRQTRPQGELVRCTISSTASSSTASSSTASSSTASSSTASDQQGVLVSRTAAGRGAWLCSMNCYRTAMQRKAFDRSWKRSVPTDSLLTLGDSLRVAFVQDMKESSVVGNAPDSSTPRKG